MHCTSVLQRTNPNNKIKNDNNISDAHCASLQNAGITLIALIITIILLLILAGVTIHFTLGENGILKNASIAGEKYEEANAKEQLTLELGSIQTKIYKETGKKATLEDIKNLINKDKYNVDIEEGSTFAQIEDLENEYTFAVDENLTIQDVEKITNKDKSIKIETSATNKSDFTTSTIKAKITLSEEIASIKIGEEEIEIPTKTEEPGKNVYEIEKEVDKNGNYKIKIETVSGRTNYKIQQVKDLSEDMEIYTASDLVRFRDRVEQGATYEGRTITVMDNIDLSTVCGSNVNGKEVSWKPIGYKTLDPEKEGDDYTYFKGTFNGQYKHINNLYINTDEYEYAGLFCYNFGTIKNLIMNNVYIYVDYSESEYAADWCNYIGSLVGYNDGTIENVGINSGSITNINTVKSNYNHRTQAVGGIVGLSGCTVENSYNCTKIYVENSEESNVNPDAYNEVGGIAGVVSGGTYIKNCYNTGSLEAYKGRINAVGGIVGDSFSGQVVNCYNYGAVSGTGTNSSTNLIAGIVGRNGYTSATKGTITNSYCTDKSATYSSYYSNTSSHYTTGRVTESVLKGYAGKLNEKDEEGNEIEVWVEDTGINNGYPILKWQVQVH